MRCVFTKKNMRDVMDYRIARDKKITERAVAKKLDAKRAEKS